MNPNRFRMVTALMVVLAICTGIFLGGCASIDEKAGPEVESSSQSDDQSTALEQTSGSSLEVQNEPVVYTGGSGEESPVQETGAKSGEDAISQLATYIAQRWERVLPEMLSDLNWNRILTVLGGIVTMSLIYGLAFGLGRLPLHRRGADLRGGGRQTAEQASGSVPE